MKQYDENEMVIAEVGGKEVLLRVSYYMPCHLDMFVIDGIKANENDFGSMEFYENEYGGDGCYMRFVRKAHTLEVLSKYAITETEYDVICDMLQDELFTCDCSMCE